MKLIVADAYGSGYVESSEHGPRHLSFDSWTEVGVGDRIVAGEYEAFVQYHSEVREITVPPGETYLIEVDNPDVIDVRGASHVADELIAAMQGFGTDEQRLFNALEQIPTDRNREPFIEQVRGLYQHHTGQTLDAALADELSGDDLERAQRLLR